ncbi:hypothetical protein D9611_014308 [Ephemerocybe angulata]|uniref:UBL3-like ubiquitin domain-containing protein n=1 Tax=Ephemerocybe angulata TaxID=980116 RepID=A0A8H5BVE4_9AGAR|nr:hypothetical protein D9611_014308 [Tulosesus angulatus]
MLTTTLRPGYPAPRAILHRPLSFPLIATPQIPPPDDMEANTVTPKAELLEPAPKLDEDTATTKTRGGEGGRHCSSTDIALWRESHRRTRRTPRAPFLFLSGRRRVMNFDPDTTIGRVKDLVWTAWSTPAATSHTDGTPSGAQEVEEKPPAPSYLRVLYLGRMLQDDDTLRGARGEVSQLLRHEYLDAEQPLPGQRRTPFITNHPVSLQQVWSLCTHSRPHPEQSLHKCGPLATTSLPRPHPARPTRSNPTSAPTPTPRPAPAPHAQQQHTLPPIGGLSRESASRTDGHHPRHGKWDLERIHHADPESPSLATSENITST